MNFSIDTLKQLTQNLKILYLEGCDREHNYVFDVIKNLFGMIAVPGDTDEALEIYRHRVSSGDFHDLVLLEVGSSVHERIHLANQIMQLNAQQKIIVISSDDKKDAFIDFLNIGVSGFIYCPVEYEKFFNLLHDLALKLKETKIQRKRIHLQDGYNWNEKLKLLYKVNDKVDLSSLEADLLSILICNKNSIYSDYEIFSHLYGNNHEKEFSQDSVRSLIKRLRQKLGKEFIKTHRGRGYSVPR